MSVRGSLKLGSGEWWWNLCLHLQTPATFYLRVFFYVPDQPKAREARNAGKFVISPLPTSSSQILTEGSWWLKITATSPTCLEATLLLSYIDFLKGLSPVVHRGYLYVDAPLISFLPFLSPLPVLLGIASQMEDRLQFWGLLLGSNDVIPPGGRNT